MLDKAKEFLPEWLFTEIQRAAIPQSGGKARANKRTQQQAQAAQIEKLTLEEMRPDVLTDAPDTEILSAWHRLNQWYGGAKEKNQAIENFVNAAIWVIEEMKNRKFDIDQTGDLYRAVENFKPTKKYDIVKNFYALPKETMVVRDFVSIVGSAAKDKQNPNDIDVLFRAESDEGGHYLIQSDNVWLPVRNILDPNKEDILHFILNPQGSHGDYVSCYDLVLRRKPTFKREIVKADTGASCMPDWETYKEQAPEGPRYDLGCGNSKPDGFIGIDSDNYDGVDIVTDMRYGLPIQSDTAAVIRANHFLEHLPDTENIMTEIFRSLMPGGLAIITVPSTETDGAFAHPGHKSFFNKASFDFWTNPELIEHRPCFENVCVNDREEPNGLHYIDAVLKKPGAAEEQIAKLSPSIAFVPPKPQMAGTTEAFDMTDLLKWIDNKWPIDIEPKWNGFRCIVTKDGADIRLWFEGKPSDNMIDKFPKLKEELAKINGDFILDADLGIERGGKRESRPDLMRFNADKPVFEPDETVVLTLFDLPYFKEDLSQKPFTERRDALTSLYNTIGSRDIKLSPVRWVNNENDLKTAVKWAFNQDASEGLVAKTPTGPYEKGGTNEWSKLKRIVEIKVLVLDKKETKNKGIFNYYGGIAPSAGGPQWANTETFEGKEYIDLGKTFSTKIDAKPGDILTVSILELIPDEEAKTLAWLGPTVLDIDDTRKEPYSSNQIIDIAERGKVIQKEVADIIPSSGPDNAAIGFVGASPGRIEAARGEPFVGPSGATFNDLYLKPLGLNRNDVFITNVVPLYLTDETGDVREPNPEEIAQWKQWLDDELAKANPHIIVALGQTAKKTLGEKADFVLPHPTAIRRFGDSGELNRKLKQIQRAINDNVTKADDAEGGTRAAAATDFWLKNWQDMAPTDGEGRFVYQHHWRGLTEDEKDLNEAQLLNTDNSLHGDLRFQSNDGLWGFSVFLGTTADNRKEPGGDRLINLPPEDNLQGTFKLQQPAEWLNVGTKKPYLSPPGGVGSEANTWAKFWAEDTGTYKTGVWREHMIELFIDGKKLKGRFILEYAPVGDGKNRVWLIDKPTDQTPYAESHDLADVISELKGKGQKWLIWGLPGEKPQKINVQTAKIEKQYYADILKADDEKQIVTGVVLEPNSTDSQGDHMTPDEIEMAAHFFMEKSRIIGDSHHKKAQADLVESYIAPDDFALNDQKVKKGTWVISVRITDPDLWKLVKSGYYTGFSVGGYGIRKEAKGDGRTHKS
jgi:uracil-DNA glycosylase family 4